MTFISAPDSEEEPLERQFLDDEAVQVLSPYVNECTN